MKTETKNFVSRSGKNCTATISDNIVTVTIEGEKKPLEFVPATFKQLISTGLFTEKIETKKQEQN